MQNTKKSQVTLNQGKFIITLFGFGSSVVMGISTDVKQDTWIAIIVAAIISVPLFVIYARIVRLFPEKNLFEICEILFGKIGGKAITVVIIYYSLHLTSLVTRNFSEFIQISSLSETPQLPIILIILLVSSYLASSNMRAIGKWSVICVFLVILVVLFTFGASIKQLKVDDLLPFMEYSTSDIAKSAFNIFAFPYAETVMFLCVAEAFRKDFQPYKMFMSALFLITIIFLLVFFRNLTLLGRKMMEVSYYPSYVTARIIEIGDFVARIEGSISSNFMLAGIVKIAVCLTAAANGFKSLFNFTSYRTMVLPAAMVSAAMSITLYANTMDMFKFINYYAYYAFPFQVIIPIVLWIAGEFYVRKRKTNTNLN